MRGALTLSSLYRQAFSGHEISTLYHSLTWYTLVTLVYTTRDYGVTYTYLSYAQSRLLSVPFSRTRCSW